MNMQDIPGYKEVGDPIDPETISEIAGKYSIVTSPAFIDKSGEVQTLRTKYCDDKETLIKLFDATDVHIYLYNIRTMGHGYLVRYGVGTNKQSRLVETYSDNGVKIASGFSPIRHLEFGINIEKYKDLWVSWGKEEANRQLGQQLVELIDHNFGGSCK